MPPKPTPTPWRSSVTELEPPNVRPEEAERLIEQLRYGIPPSGYVRHFTVGRQDELSQLERNLRYGMNGKAVLVRANYGAGKSHLLSLIRDLALQANYATSLIVVKAHQGVRFNRMDQVFSAVCRDIQCPGRSDSGVASLFRAYADADASKLDEDLRADRKELEDEGKWREPGLLISPAIYIALRAAVVTDDDDTRDLVSDWLTRSEPDTMSRVRLVETLVQDLRLGDPRGTYALYQDVQLRRDGYKPTWDALSDLNTVARLAGYRGLVLLFDEFEDIIQNLNNINYETTALENLFRFFSGEYDGAAYFAVTPDFVRKCKDRLLMKSVWDFAYSRFDELPHFELSPIDFNDLLRLCSQIAHVHSRAYEWDTEKLFDWKQAVASLWRHWNPHSPERIRTSATLFVDLLDRALDGIS